MADSFLTPQQIEELLNVTKEAVTEVPVAGLTLNRQDLQEQMVIMAPTATPLRNRMRRMPGNGTAHSFYRLVGNTNTDVAAIGTFFGTTPSGGFFAKGGLPNNSDASYQYVSTPYFNLGDIANVTFQDVAQGRSYWNLFAEQIKLRMLNVALMEEWAIINGNNSTNNLIFDGLKAQIEGGGGQIVPATAGQLTIALIEQAALAVFNAGGVSDTLVLDTKAKAVFNSLVLQLYQVRQIGSANLGTLAGGFTVKTWDFGYGDVDIIASRYIDSNQYNATSFALLLDFQSQDAKNGGNVITMIDVDPLNSIDLAILATSMRKLVWQTSALEVTAPAFQAEITGLTYSGQSL